jgi:hypothetical protein
MPDLLQVYGFIGFFFAIFNFFFNVSEVHLQVEFLGKSFVAMRAHELGNTQVDHFSVLV